MGCGSKAPDVKRSSISYAAVRQFDLNSNDALTVSSVKRVEVKSCSHAFLYSSNALTSLLIVLIHLDSAGKVRNMRN